MQQILFTISGDRHRGALYKSNATYELTASALNKVASQNIELDPLLVDQTFPEAKLWYCGNRF